MILFTNPFCSTPVHRPKEPLPLACNQPPPPHPGLCFFSNLAPLGCNLSKDTERMSHGELASVPNTRA